MRNNFKRLLLVPLCALGYRFRGSAGQGGWVERVFGAPVGTFKGRFFWCIPVSLMVCTHWVALLPLLVSSYLGVMLGYLGGKFDLSLEKNQNARNYAWLTLRGAIIAAPITACLWALRHYGFHDGGIGWGGIPAGSLFVLYYKAGLKISPRTKLPLLHGFSEWGELLLGFGTAVGILLTI